MIPQFNLSGVLPPYVGSDPTAGGSAGVGGLISPYRASTLEAAQRFCTSAPRVALFRGLLKYRALLVSLGLTDGYQWIDGSFSEDIEGLKQRPPNDIDVVTLVRRPAHLANNAQFQAFCAANRPAFFAADAKAKFSCDAYVIDLALPANVVIDQILYFHGLFSHQRSTNLWKGMIEIPLVADDASAEVYVATLSFPP